MGGPGLYCGSAVAVMLKNRHISRFRAIQIVMLRTEFPTFRARQATKNLICILSLIASRLLVAMIETFSSYQLHNYIDIDFALKAEAVLLRMGIF